MAAVARLGEIGHHIRRADGFRRLVGDEVRIARPDTDTDEPETDAVATAVLVELTV